MTDETDVITETLQRGEWEARQIFLKFGEAIYFCQVLEFQLVTYAQWIRRFKMGRPLTIEEVEQLRQRLISRSPHSPPDQKDSDSAVGVGVKRSCGLTYVFIEISSSPVEHASARQNRSNRLNN